MRLLLMMIFLTSSVSCLSQQHDTLFLKRSAYVDTPYNNPIYHAIYIEKDYTHCGLKSLVDFSFGEFDSTNYFEGLKDLTKTKFTKHIINKQFPKKWIALYIYKNEFYTYAPSDFGNHYKFQITDTTTIDFGMEGPEPSKILSAKQISSNKIELKRKNYWQGHKVIINIIDSIKGIAVFTFSSTRYRPHNYKRLMVSEDKAYLFKTVVNYCESQKMFEFNFDKINFEKLLKN